MERLGKAGQVKVAELYDKFVLKYGQDTMKVPTGDYQGEAPPPVVEIPSSPKVPSFEEPRPSYDDVHIMGRSIPPEKAILILIARCGETELFTPSEITKLTQMARTKGPYPTFKEVSHQVQKRLFNAETCLQILRNLSIHFR